MSVPLSETPSTSALPARAVAQESLLPQIFRVAWLSVGVGIALEILLLVLAAFSGTAGESGKPALAELAQKISWSFLVCVGLAFGTAAKKLREAVMGGFGFLAAPLAFIAAKAVHKGVGQALGTIAPGVPFTFPLLIAAVKALEYGALGALLGYASARNKSLAFHVAAGIATGVTFGVLLIWAGARAQDGPTSAVDLASRGINEILFPLGCSLVIYAGEAFGRRMQGA
ncbi:MAG TPA: hypothetical protein VGS22_12430 [Thermoanaerobaculia bacterium]|jgi:hypothetical protein|nr:hypothetical protein [Thermoanaerobaculia bacterium]